MKWKSLKSWKTSLAGVLAVAGVVVGQFWPEHAPFVDKLVVIAVGLGLVAARDNNVSSQAAGVR